MEEVVVMPSTQTIQVENNNDCPIYLDTFDNENIPQLIQLDCGHKFCRKSSTSTTLIQLLLSLLSEYCYTLELL